MYIKEDSPSQLISIENLPENYGGGKAQGLKFLYSLGLPVPATCVLFGHLIIEEEAEGIFSLLGSENLAVRSSSYAEDAVSHSAAGQYETRLSISTAGELIDSIQFCRESSSSERVSKYNNSRGIASSHERGVIPLVIQQMITPRTAGVLFTIDPITGSRGHMVIEAAEGSGEKVVGGSSLTSGYRIDRNRGNIECRGPSILTDKNLDDLQSGALLAEKEAGYPLDLEWAIDDQEQLWWLQSRPVTTLDDQMLNSIVYDDQLILTNGNIGEVFPGSTTPLTYSTAGLALDVGMQKMYKKVGVPIEGIKNEHFVHHYDSHLFFCMNNIWSMAPYVLSATEDQMDLSICGTIVGDRGTLIPVKNIFTRIVNLFRYLNLLLHPDKLIEEMSAMNRDIYIPDFRDSEKIRELFDLLRDDQDKLNHAYYLHYAISGHSALMNIILEKSLKDKNDILTSLSDIPDIESARIPRELKIIARKIMKEPAFKEFCDLETIEQLKWIERNKALNALWTDFMLNHGHRSIKELEMREKEWSAYPGIILSYISGIIRSMENEDGDQIREPHQSSENQYPKAARKARDGVRKRELSKSLLVKFQNNFKRGWRNLAELLHESDKLESRDFIYFLTLEEIEDLIDAEDREIIKSLNELSSRRKRRFDENDILHFPRISRGRPQPLSNINEGDSDKMLSGVPVSKGVYTGVVRIVRTFEDANSIEQGEIMVSTYTDIGWSPYYSMCGGLITELGSPLSHGAVVAREYGVPLVSCVQGATARLKTGDIVRVNGTAGHVEIVLER